MSRACFTIEFLDPPDSGLINVEAALGVTVSLLSDGPLCKITIVHINNIIPFCYLEGGGGPAIN